jgi:hypothetical protein
VESSAVRQLSGRWLARLAQGAGSPTDKAAGGGLGQVRGQHKFAAHCSGKCASYQLELPIQN